MILAELNGNGLMSYIATGFFSLISGGIGLTVINSLLNRKKNKVEITDQSIRTALDLEKLSKERYFDEVERNTLITNKLHEVAKLLVDIKVELVKKNHYIDTLKKILIDNDIKIPDLY